MVVVLLVLVGSGLWWRSTYSEDTDDAQVNGHLIQVSARISGQVVKVDVEENQLVKKGDAIAELDPRDYQVAVENAQAALDSAQANAAGGQRQCAHHRDQHGQQSELGERRCQRCACLSGAGPEAAGSGAGARVAQAEANNTKAQADLKRYKPLVEKDVISKQQYDAAVAAADVDKAALADAEANEEAAQDGMRVATERENAGAGSAEICADRPAAGCRCRARAPSRPGAGGAGAGRSSTRPSST